MNDNEAVQSLALLSTLTKGGRTRIRLLEGAIVSFTKRGFENCSFATLAKDAKVHQTLFVHYFKSKELILEESLDYVLQLGANYTDWFLKQERQARDSITQYFDASFSWFDAYPVHARFFFLCLHRSFYHSKMRSRFGSHFEAAHKRVEKLLLSQEMDPSLALAIHSMITGALVNACAKPKGKQVEFLKSANGSLNKLLEAVRVGIRLPSPK